MSCELEEGCPPSQGCLPCPVCALPSPSVPALGFHSSREGPQGFLPQEQISTTKWFWSLLALPACLNLWGIFLGAKVPWLQNLISPHVAFMAS